MRLRWHISYRFSYCNIAAKTAVYYKPCLQCRPEHFPFRVICNQVGASPGPRLSYLLGMAASDVCATDCNFVMNVYIARGLAHVLITPHAPVFKSMKWRARFFWLKAVKISCVCADNVNHLLRDDVFPLTSFLTRLSHGVGWPVTLTDGRNDVAVVGHVNTHSHRLKQNKIVITYILK